jgi:hypothetical protein
MSSAKRARSHPLSLYVCVPLRASVSVLPPLALRLPSVPHARNHQDSDEEAEDESEKVQVLASFYYQGDKYVVATPLEPVLIIGEARRCEHAKVETSFGWILDSTTTRSMERYLKTQTYTC